MRHSIVLGLAAVAACGATKPSPGADSVRTSVKQASATSAQKRKLDYPGYTRRQGRWIAFGLGRSQLYLIDSLSAEIRGDTVRLWVATKPSTDTSTYEAKWKSKALYEMNCRDGTLRTLESIVYDDQGNVERSFTKASDISHPVPETIGESIYGIACNPTAQ